MDSKGTRNIAAVVPYLTAIATIGDTPTAKEDITMTRSKVKDTSLQTMIDSGSDLSFISEKAAKRLNLFVIPSNEHM